MDEDSKRTNLTISAMSYLVEELRKENETLRSKNLSRINKKRELFTKYMDRFTSNSPRAITHKLPWSLPRLHYNFSKNVGKAIATCAGEEFREIRTNSETVSQEYMGRFQRMDDKNNSSLEAFDVYPFSPMLLENPPLYFDSGMIGDDDFGTMLACGQLEEASRATMFHADESQHLLIHALSGNLLLLRRVKQIISDFRCARKHAPLDGYFSFSRLHMEYIAPDQSNGTKRRIARI